MSPDLMIAAGLERPEIADVLRESGIRVLDVRIRTIEELFEATCKIGWPFTVLETDIGRLE